MLEILGRFLMDDISTIPILVDIMAYIILQDLRKWHLDWVGYLLGKLKGARLGVSLGDPPPKNNVKFTKSSKIQLKSATLSTNLEVLFFFFYFWTVSVSP